MIFNSKEAYDSLIAELDRRAVKYLVHEFSSGTIMIDIWQADLFYVVQIESDSIGMSLITEDNIGFDQTPDNRFFTVKDFIANLKNIF